MLDSTPFPSLSAWLNVSLRVVPRGINAHTHNLPLVAVLDQTERHRGFCVFELRLSGVMAFDALPATLVK